MSKSVYIYGLGGADQQYVAIKYVLLMDEDISISNIIREAQLLKIRNPDIQKVFAIDNYKGLRRDYLESIKKHTIESCAIFKDILERDGIQII